MSLQPILFIGVGGTGGTVIGVIQQRLRTTMDSIDFPGIPVGWQFLHIDVTSDPDSKTSGLAYNIPRTQYLPLTNHQTNVPSASMAISNGLQVRSRERYLAWDNWRPVPPEATGIHLPSGAGQFRGLGRLASASALDDVDARIRAARSPLSSDEARNQFADVQFQRGITGGDEVRQRPVAVVVGSVAGGSGSGMLLDVCEVVRSHQVAEVLAVIFTPEVFERADGSRDAGIAPNTFMAVNELSNAMWTTGAQNASSRDLFFQRAGLHRTNEFGGPTAVFMVGRTSPGITLSTSQVYAAVGHSFAELALDESLSTHLITHELANIRARTQSATDNLGLSPQGSRDDAMYNALGVARVSVGRDLFAGYTTERLLRRAATRLLEQHLSAKRADDGKTNDELLAEAVARNTERFVDEVGIDEAGDDDIVEALDPLADLEPKLRTLADEVVANIAAKASRTGMRRIETVHKSVARQEARALVSSALHDDQGLLREARRLFTQNLAAWVPSITDSIRTTIIRTAAREGLPVTSRLLDHLIDHSRKGVTSLTEIDVVRARKVVVQKTGALQGSDESRINIEDRTVLDKLATHARQAVEYEIRVQTFTDTAVVLKDLIENLLKPWKSAIASAEALLEQTAKPPRMNSPLLSMPDEQGRVPDHLQPSETELLLDDWREFPQAFETQVSRSVGEGYDTLNGRNTLAALDEATRQVIAGRRLPQDEAHPLAIVAEYQRTWVPVFLAGYGDKEPAQAVIATRLGLPHLRKRILAWLSDPRKNICGYIKEDISAFLTGRDEDPIDEATRTRRGNLFIAQLTSALLKSSPLVATDPDLLNQINGNTEPEVRAILSPIPIPDMLTDLRERTEGIFNQVYKGAVEPTYTASPASEILIMSVFAANHHPLVFSSIMGPIASQLLQKKSGTDFWKYRRTAPLPEWVPLSPTSRDALVRGWYAARVLGRARYTRGTLQVHVPAAHQGEPGTWIDLPKGHREVSTEDVIGNLLEAVSFALITAYQQKSLEPLAPFHELIALGSTIGTENNDVLRQWVASGEGIVDAASAYKAPQCGTTPSERANALRDHLDVLIRQRQKDSTDADLAHVATAQLRPRHEVLEVTVAALTALQASAVVTEELDTEYA